MISVIVQKGFGHYVRLMIAAFLRLLTLLALVLMPLGMSAAPAAAQTMPMSHNMALTGHCDEQPNQDQAPVSKMDCTAMCIALPAADSPMPGSALKPVTPRSIALAAPFAGIQPEIATPPPKHG